MMKKTEFLIYVLALVFLWALCFEIPAMYPHIYSEGAKAVAVHIRRGESSAALVRRLKKLDLILFEKPMRVWLALSGEDKTLQPGVCKIMPGSVFTVARGLKNSKPEYLAVSLIPGRTLSENAEKNGLRKEKLNEALSKAENFPAEIRVFLPDNAAARIVFLLPETYFLAPNKSMETELVKNAAALWHERVGKKLPKAKHDKRALVEAGILASVVEGEARVKEDRPVLAAIFRKRLKIPMRLQSCATVIYCWKEFKGIKKTRLTYDDLNIDSPFNTYRHDGLPPLPINIPSADCWFAVCEDSDTPYLYFAADGNGRHIFSKSYAEHLKNQGRIR